MQEVDDAGEEENVGEEDAALPLGLLRLDPARDDDDVDDLLRYYPMAATACASG